MHTEKTYLNTLSQKKCCGTSLIETVVALFLFAIFIAGACKVIMAHRKVTDKARAHYTAVNIAKNQIEQVRNTLTRVGFDQIYNNEENDIRVASNGDVSNVGKFRRTTEINAISTDMAEIVVTVQIQDRIKLEFGNENEELRTYIARPR